jgi:hypothetical protein
LTTDLTAWIYTLLRRLWELRFCKSTFKMALYGRTSSRKLYFQGQLLILLYTRYWIKPKKQFAVSSI